MPDRPGGDQVADYNPEHKPEGINIRGWELIMMREGWESNCTTHIVQINVNATEMSENEIPNGVGPLDGL